eukprot:XP_003728515.1 PREDICTED: uncharacterized protein LOC100890640 [Strongylocentrotus purpuratus]
MAVNDEPPVIGLLSLNNMDEKKASFIAEYITGSDITPDLKQICSEEVPFFRPPQHWDAVFLFQPSLHGRLSLQLSDITTAQYDILIPKLAEAYGNRAIGFIVCGVEGVNKKSLAQEFEVLKRNQPSLVQYTSGIVIFCTKIDTILKEDSSRIKTFIIRISEVCFTRKEEISRQQYCLELSTRESAGPQYNVSTGSNRKPIIKPKPVADSKWF